MPQIWLTYAEAGEFLGCSNAEARAHSIAMGWDRKRSRDGQSRLKLPQEEAEQFLESHVTRRLEALQASSFPVRNLQERALAFSERLKRFG